MNNRSGKDNSSQRLQFVFDNRNNVQINYVFFMNCCNEKSPTETVGHLSI